MILIRAIYSIAVNIRNFLYDKKVLPSYTSSIPIISVGNITTGGTGKTPFVIFLANYLKDSGYQPLIISRGYKRASRKQILINKSGKNVSVDEVGDEPYLMSQLCNNIDILINKNRVAAVRWAEKQNKKYDCIVLDDGFQHRAINRDFNVLLICSKQNMSAYPPQGDLREPLNNIDRSDCVVFTKGAPSGRALSMAQTLGLPIFKSHQNYQIVNNETLKQGVSFCGIANPDFFIQTLSSLSIKTKDHLSFKDHQNYSQEIIEKIEDMLIKNKETVFFTTRKDWVKLPKALIQKYHGVCIDLALSISGGADQLNFEKMLLKKIKND